MSILDWRTHRWVMTLAFIGLHLQVPEAMAGGRPGGGAQAMDPIEVTVVWRERILLPAAARLVVTVEDVARAGGPSVVLREVVLDGLPPPVSVEVPLDGVQLDPRARYSVRARVLVEGRLRMTSDQVRPVLRTPEDRRVEVILRGVPHGNERPLTPPETDPVDSS